MNLIHWKCAAAKLALVAGTFDAITTNRPYHTRISEEQAIKEMEALSAKWFDPATVEALKAIIGKQHR